MDFSYLTEDNLFDKYKASKKYTEALTEPFPEYERIARNRPYDGINKKYPKVTDGTTSAIIRKTSRRVLQQIPTGSVLPQTEDDWLPLVADFKFRTEILPNANEDYDLIQKGWTVIERGLTFGSAASYTPFLAHDGIFTPDMTIPFWGDIYLQEGKKSGYSCKYLFMRAWFQKEDVESIIDQEKKLAKQAKEAGTEYENSWDSKALKELLEAVEKKDDDQKQAFEKERNTEDSGIELVTAFQVGRGATFFTFHPGQQLIVRRKKNKDPRGKMPLDFFYAETDGSNPLGRGIVELIGGLQNMIDSDMQMYHWNRALMIDPPMKKKGQFNVATIGFEPGRINDLGTDPNADLVVMTVDTSAVQNYPSLYGLQKSQLLNLVSSPDTSISAEVGNPGFSKTPAGINQQKANVSVDDNYIRKMFEAWFQNWAETAINLYFAERSGIEEVTLDSETAGKLRKLAEEGKFDISLLSEDNRILLNFDDATEALKFRVDASTSKLQDDATKQEALTALIQAIDSSPTISGLISSQYPDKIIALWNKIVDTSGVEDPEDITIDLEEFKQQLEAQGTPEEMPQKAIEDPLITQLMQLGVDEETIALAQEGRAEGATDEEILQAVGVNSGR